MTELNVAYGGELALKGVDMKIFESQITAFIGPSGCGKSTYIRCFNRMNDLIPGAEVQGEVLYHGQDLYGRDVDPVAGPPPDRHGLPEAEPVRQVDLRQRRVRTARARHEEGARRAGRAVAAPGSSLGRGEGPAQGERIGPVRRAAAAPLHRARARRGAGRAPDGRALLGARSDRDRADRGPDVRS